MILRIFILKTRCLEASNHLIYHDMTKREYAVLCFMAFTWLSLKVTCIFTFKINLPCDPFKDYINANVVAYPCISKSGPFTNEGTGAHNRGTEFLVLYHPNFSNDFIMGTPSFFCTRLPMPCLDWKQLGHLSTYQLSRSTDVF